MTDMTVKEHGESRRVQTKGLGHIEGVSEAFRQGNGAYRHLTKKGLQSLVQNRFAFASKMPIRFPKFSCMARRKTERCVFINNSRRR